MEEVNKRFLLFAFADYYPSGGLSDVLKEFDTEPDARAYIQENLYDLSDYAYLFDCERRQVIWTKEF